MACSVVLLSGGIDSAVVLRGIASSAPVVPLFLAYGQRAAQSESAAAKAQCDDLGLTLVSLDVSSVADAVVRDSRVRAHAPLPHRNLVLLSLALSYASALGADAVTLSIIRDDGDWYATASQPFIDAMRQVTGLLRAPAIDTPLITLDKQAVIARGIRLGLDFSTTYSCMVGGEAHCGRCHQCTARRSALRQAGVSEPPGFYLHD